MVSGSQPSKSSAVTSTKGSDKTDMVRTRCTGLSVFAPTDLSCLTYRLPGGLNSKRREAKSST